MASSKRERELARMRAERQAARRQAAEARRRQRNATLGAVAGVLVVVLIAVGVFLATRSTNSAAVAAASPSASPAVSATPAASTPGTCSYTKSGSAAKPLKLMPPATGVETKKPFTAFLSTNVGQVDVTLSTAKAPCTVNNFRALAAFGFFNDTPCHRLTTQGIFVLQCGDPTGTGSGGPGWKFADENLTGATYPRGTVAMANSGPGTNGSQFFLVYKDSQLPPMYTPFGTITKGLDLLDKVAAAGSSPTGDGKPKKPVQILKAYTKPGTA